MNALSVKAYATKYRLPIYNVVKMARNGDLEAELRDVDGRREYFILNDKAPASKKVKQETITDYKKAYEELHLKYEALLKKMV